ncbi:TetR/AcrR family transcriptional regulator [Nocardiopsis sp. MG754419]|uniref:TetR/AcrR family transcriptional regulator n=1 Tax=Nocardiopsis sp. MG754419 TaxID=2259865 RepID=UPI001BAAA0BE|nr:TetR/AcrR family transcriptional regulator [Nocardiopsis sp. MG754419]MBR8741021.1 TetR family transcriptional regulator [Nocardiopsis sp. MG754419]
MSSDTSDTGNARPGGRTARNTTAVLQATLDHLGEHGYQRISVDLIAAHSGVHKATIYRRWGGVDGLLTHALEWSASLPWEPARTGALHSDLVALNTEVAEGFTVAPERRVSYAAIAAAFESEAAAAALRTFMADRHRRSAVLVSEAVARGEAPEGTDAEEVVRAAVAPIYHRLLVCREPVEAAHVRRAARIAADAAAAGAFLAED